MCALVERGGGGNRIQCANKGGWHKPLGQNVCVLKCNVMSTEGDAI